MDSTTERRSLRPLDELSPDRAGRVQILATDVDGTITKNGRLSAALVDHFETLARQNIEVILVSGRPAGEVVALCRYLPGVSRGIAENGMVLVRPDHPVELLVDSEGQKRALAFAEKLSAQLEDPLQAAPDRYCRRADLAFERAGRGAEELEAMDQAARAQGLHCIWSNVHIHFSVAAPDKGRGLLEVLGRELSREAIAQTVATIGDAPNDRGLFVKDRFGVTVGTAQLADSAAEMSALPEFLSAYEGAVGFAELAQKLLVARSSDKAFA